MRTRVGLWIDHRKAIVVTVSDKGDETRLVISTVEKQLRRSGDSPSRVVMSDSKSWQMIASRKASRDISTPTTMRLSRPLVVRRQF